MTISAANWNYPTAIRFGDGRITELAAVCSELGITKALLVTDPGIADLPMIADAVAANRAAGLPTDVFSDINPNPLGSDVDCGLEVIRSGGHDGVIVFGGGSAMDAGKTIAFMAGQTRSMFDFEDRGDNWTHANADAILPIVAVPTTSGTGSEVGRAAVIIDEADQTKKILYHPRMLPGIVIEDPALTVGLPASITAWTGMDALAHCLEAYSAPGYHPMADGIALEGMRLVKEWLPVAVADGRDIDARGHMQIAATMGATAFQKGLGAIHSLSHPIGALFNTHHGRTNAVVMPYVMAFNRDTVADRYAALARYLDIGDGFDAVMEWVLELRTKIGIEHTLADIGVDNSRVDTVIAQAVNDPTAGTNPVPLDNDNLAHMFTNALEGRLN
ncbi:MAG: iron-containing alcohol dehydrogenase [Rhodospirillales bacterium]|nr:iron-containing alcohol dehydrogenase [Rhodospirillales bacterium]